MKALLCSVLIAVFALVAAAETDVSGKWSGSFVITRANGESKDATALLILKQSGTDITGTVGPDESQQFPVQKGKIEGNKITIEADHDGQAIKLALVVAADRITGEATLSRDGQTDTAKIDVTRMK